MAARFERFHQFVFDPGDLLPVGRRTGAVPGAEVREL
jgi:hypothetical protein